MCMSMTGSDRDALAVSRRDILKLLGAVGLGASALAYVRSPALAGSMSFLDQNEFIDGLKKVLDRAGSTELDDYRVFRLDGKDLPWRELGLEAQQGQAVTFLLGGRLWLSRPHDLWVEPGTAFHVRSRGQSSQDSQGPLGPMYNPMLNNGTMLATHDGALEIARSLAEWENADGELWTPVDAYVQTDVEIYGVALKWKGDAAAGIKSLLVAGDVGGVLQRELDRLESMAGVPTGWHNHFNAGGDDVIFRSGGAGQITCQSHKTGGLLQHPAQMPLVPGTRLQWRWIVEELPSALPENQLASHDYLSIGVEFDDGQDLTYIWSQSLPKDTVFRCPIPRWTPIETHLVVRTGYDELGQWLDEERDVYADYQAHVGGTAKNVVRVWLLAVTIFQRRSGACRYASINLQSPDQVHRIL